MRHRLGRIHAITRRNPLRDDDRFALAVALWAADRTAPARRLRSEVTPEATDDGDAA